MIKKNINSNNASIEQQPNERAVIKDDKPVSDILGSPNLREMAEKMSGTGSWRYSKACRELLISKNAYAIFDLDENIDVIRHMIRLLPRNTTRSINKKIAECLSNGEPFSIDYQFCSTSGVLYHGTIFGEAERDHDGAIIAVVGIIRDLTLQSNLQYENRMFLRTAKLGSLQVDDENQIVTLSPEAAQLLGYEENPLQIRIGEWHRKIHPDDRDQAIKSCEGGLQSAKTNTCCYRLRHQNGEWRWFEIRSQALHDNQDKPLILYAAIMDVHEQMLAKRKIADSEERFNDVLSQTKEAIFELNEQGRFTYISDMGPVLFGYTREEFLQMTSYDLMPDPPISREEWLQGLSTGGPTERLKHFARKDGSLIDVQVNFLPIKNASGKVTGFRGAARDVTEHRKIRERLQKSEARYKEVIGTAGGCMFETDANGCFTYICETAEDLFGYKPEELIGKPTYFLSTPPEEGHDKWVKALHASGKFNVQEKKMSPKDGQDGRWLRITGRSLENQSGEITGFRGAIFDISERKQSAEKIRETGERLKEVIRAARGLTFDLDIDGKFSFVSEALSELAGYTQSELLGEYTWILAPDMQPFHKGWLESLRKSDGGHTLEFRMQDQKTWLEVHCAARWDAEGECFGYRGVAFDITKKKNAERELLRAKKQAEEAAQERARFLSTMSHEIRTPLNAVIGMTDLLMDGTQSPEREKLTKTANMAGRHLLNLVNDILDHAKLDAGKVVLEEIPFELEEELQNVSDILLASAEEKGLQLKINIEATLAKTYIGDPARIRQILLNLVGNAIKFTETGSVYLKVLNTDADHIRFEVVDTGIGISEDNQKHLFQDFSQADASTTRKHGGTGLGLAICKRLVSVMNGDIGVISEPGAGSCFWFELPLSAPETVKPDEENLDTPDTKTPENTAFDVLVAEDNPANQLLIRTLLTKLDQNVTVVENGELAVQAASAHAFDIIFMDMRMPQMDGYTAAKTLRSLGNTTPIIALTAHIIKDEEEKFREAGMNDWLSKPFNIQELVKRLYHWGEVSRTSRAETDERAVISK